MKALSAKQVSLMSSDGLPILSVNDWFTKTRLKEKPEHWVDGYSAKELAKAWFRNGFSTLPSEVETLLESHPLTQRFVGEYGIPEHETKLDTYRGMGRVTDLVLVGKCKEDVKTLIAIEAKTNEEFGNTIKNRIDEAAKKPDSNVKDRIDLLVHSILGKPLDKKIEMLRYQLLHALAGALIEAKNRQAKQVVFIIYEFNSKRTRSDPERLKQNLNDLTSFFHFFEELVDANFSEALLWGPAKVLGNQDSMHIPNNIPFLVGKIVTPI